MSWNCPVCGEGYPNSDNAGVPPDGVIVLVMARDMDALTPHLPKEAVVRYVSKESKNAEGLESSDA